MNLVDNTFDNVIAKKKIFIAQILKIRINALFLIEKYHYANIKDYISLLSRFLTGIMRNYCRFSGF